MTKSESYSEIVLKEGRSRALLRGHPWVFSGAIDKAPANLKVGEVVDLFDHEHKFLARGLWSDGSIAVKVLSFEDRLINQDFWTEAISKALTLRRDLGLVDNSNTNAFRLVHGEGDSLPGVIVDIYSAIAVLQLQNQALLPHLPNIVNALQQNLEGRLKGIVNKSSVSAESKNPEDILWGSGDLPVILENSLSFKVDWRGGQKTGFFLDQRDNRALLREYTFGKVVLNAFCYTGAFSLYALAGGASAVFSLDASRRAIESLNENLALNTFSGKHESVCADYFNFIKENSQKFDFIILDPPAFAKHRDAIDEALKGYTNINYYALKALNSNGMMMTFSCSQLVSWESFWRAVQEGAIRAGRTVKIIKRLYQAACHPVSISHPEGEYLKGFLLYVE